MKFLYTLLAVCCLNFSVTAMANVSMEMFQMSRSMGQLLKADSTDHFQENAENFLTAAKKAKETMPRSLDNDQQRFQGYQQGMQEVIDVVEQANQLAQQGKLEEAKTAVSQLNQLKKIYHSEYK